METFKKFINEDTMPYAGTSKGVIDLRNPEVRDSINTLIDGVTAKGFITPYIGMERVSKVLANFHIFLPSYTFAEGSEGMTVFSINQFGPKLGMTDSGEVKENNESEYHLYFEYVANEDGIFDVFASVVTEEELEDLIDDYEDEMEDEDEESEEMNEEKMTDAQMKKREEIVKSMKKKMADFKDRYGDKAKDVMYATATKQAMAEASEKKLRSYMAANEKDREKLSKEIGFVRNDKPTSKQKKLIAKLKSRDDMDTLASKKVYPKVWTGKDSAKVHAKEDINEASKEMLSRYLDKKNKESGRPGKKAKSMSMALAKLRPDVYKGKAKVVAKEEADQIDEALPLQYFIQTGKRAAKRAEKKPDMRRPFDDVVKDAVKSAKKKQKSKVAKEEAEQIDEISKKTLASYIKSASHDVATRSAVTRGFARDAEEKKKKKDYMGAKRDSAKADKMFKKSWKRRAGIAKAADKLAKD